MMRDSGMDLFDPRTTVMDPDYSFSPSGSRDPDFAFAFNDSNFLNRVLRIEIITDSMEAVPESEGCKTIVDWALSKTKRHRGDIAKKENALEMNNCPEEQILDCQPDAEDGVGDENHDEEEIPMIEDSPSGDEALHSDKLFCKFSSVIRVKTFHISSVILDAKSPPIPPPPSISAAKGKPRKSRLLDDQRSKKIMRNSRSKAGHYCVKFRR